MAAEGYWNHNADRAVRVALRRPSDTHRRDVIAPKRFADVGLGRMARPATQSAASRGRQERSSAIPRRSELRPAISREVKRLGEQDQCEDDGEEGLEFAKSDGAGSTDTVDRREPGTLDEEERPTTE